MPESLPNNIILAIQMAPTENTLPYRILPVTQTEML